MTNKTRNANKGETSKEENKTEENKKEENSFVFYRSFYDVINLIPDAAMRCRAYTAICEYGFFGVEPAEDEEVMVKMVFTQAKPQIDANNKRRESASAGGIARKKKLEAQKAKAVPVACHPSAEAVPALCQTGADGVPNENDKENEKENENENDHAHDRESGRRQTPHTAKPFTPPALEEVQAYIAERNLTVDAERFVDYYTANGWMVGKNHMKDWKAAVRHWSRGDDRNTAKGRDYTHNPHGKGDSSNGACDTMRQPQFGLCL